MLIFFSSYLGQDASFAFSRAFSAGFQFNLKERKGWYICRSSNKTYHRADLEADFHLDNINWLRRCAFVLRPLSATESPRMNCFGTNKPGPPPPPPPHRQTNNKANPSQNDQLNTKNASNDCNTS